MTTTTTLRFERKNAPMSTSTILIAPTTPDADRPAPKPGDTVRFQGADALVVRVRPTGLVDVVEYDNGGKPTAHDRVAHGPQGWCWPGEEPPRPPTLEELLDRAEAEGRRVPRPGTPVLYLSDDVADRVHQDIRGRRARVIRPTGLDTADLEVFELDQAPLDPDDPDPVAGVARAVRHDPSGHKPDRFAYLGDGFVPPGRVRFADAQPRWRRERPTCPTSTWPG
jgi:hypothetical protein